MTRRAPLLAGGGFLPLALPLVLLLAPMCSGSPPPAAASGDAIEAAVVNAEAELAKAAGGDDA